MVHQKVGFIGVGNMGQAMIRRLLETQTVKPTHLYAANRSPSKLQKLADETGLQTFKNNEELIECCDIIIVAVKPQDLLELLEPLASSFHESNILISLAAGLSISSIQKVVTETHRIARVMPNTPMEIGKAVIGYSIAEGADSVEPVLQDLFEPMGYVVPVDEGEEFEALTVACGSGTGFVFELMQYWQDWIEDHGFDAESARNMTVQTFIGAALLAEKAEKTSLSELQKRVVSKKGVTHSGLESMRELEVDRALRYSFQKAVLRDRELGQTKN